MLRHTHLFGGRRLRSIQVASTLLFCTTILSFSSSRITCSQEWDHEIINGVALTTFDYATNRDETNIPIIYFHGTSSSKLEPLVVLEHIKKKKRTLIAFDRPGYGDSKFVHFESLKDYDFWSQTHLIPAIETSLGYTPQQFDLVSVSGGAQYSLRMAQVVPNRVRKLSLISAGFFGRPVRGEGLYERTRRFAVRRPVLSDAIIQFARTNPKLTQAIAAKKFSEPDKRFSESRKSLWAQILLDATKQGAMGLRQDARMQLFDTSYATPLASSIVTEFWNGTCDNTISTKSAMLLSQKTNIPVNFVKNEGHLSSIPIGFEQSVLKGE